MSALFYERLFPSHVAFCTKLRVYGFLQGENNRQPASDGADTKKSNDQVRRPQQTGLEAGQVEKGGDAAEKQSGGNIGQPWTIILGVL